MKVFLDYKIGESGKGFFLRRLIPALSKIGVTVTDHARGADVALGVTKWRTKTSLPKVLRVDGIYLAGEDKRDRWINKQIKASIEQSDMVIFQSRFAEKMIRDHIKPRIKSCCVIYNGADPKDYRGNIGNGIISFAKWQNRHGLRKSKKLKSAIRFLEATDKRPVYLAGPVPDKYIKKGGPIVFLGKLDQKTLAYYMSHCDTMYYPAKYDWCPNAVVEAIIAGMRIIHNPDCEAVAEMLDRPWTDFNINYTARLYAKVFKKTGRTE